MEYPDYLNNNPGEMVYEYDPQNNSPWKLVLGLSLAAFVLIFIITFVFIKSMCPFSISEFMSMEPEWATIAAILYLLTQLFTVCILLFIPFSLRNYLSARVMQIYLRKDRLDIVKKDNRIFPVMFSDIDSFEIFRIKKPDKRLSFSHKILIKRADQYHIDSDYKEISNNKVKIRLEAYPLVGDLYRPGNIQISRKAGTGILKFIFPWLDTLEKSRHYTLALTDPDGFYDKLSSAYMKWQNKN